jgi:hypothetical protein
VIFRSLIIQRSFVTLSLSKVIHKKSKNTIINFLPKYYFLFLACCLFQFTHAQNGTKPRILISTDIGGTDPDDNQSMIHLLMYADRFQIEGLLSTSFIKGRKENILEMIRLYGQDRKELKRHAKGFPTTKSLIKITKQGAIAAHYKGYASPTEGSDWLIHCARKNQPNLCGYWYGEDWKTWHRPCMMHPISKKL